MGHFGEPEISMLAAATAAFSLSAGLIGGVAPGVQLRAAAPNMADISAFGDIWGIEAKTAIFNAWDPESPRTYDNFNPFERNDEGTMCDTNGCFPGQSRGYKPPNRPDQSWAIMQAEQKAMEEIKALPKCSLTGKPKLEAYVAG